MKKFSIVIALVLAGLGAQAQSRKHVSQFAQFQQNYNPALTGNQGSLLKTFYRDQWAGFEDAPRTLFASLELNVADIKNKALFAGETTEEAATSQSPHAFGLSLLHDSFGPQQERQLSLNYSTGIRLNETLRLRAGAGLSYHNLHFDRGKMVAGGDNDQGMGNILASEGLNRLGLNLGLALAADDFYIGYSMQDAVQHARSGKEYFGDTYGLQHVGQAGFRKGLTDKLGLVANALYRYDNNLKGLAEGQLKAVYNNAVWVGGGYRQDLAYTFSAGFRLQQLQLGYSRDVATGNANGVYKGGNELTLSYSLAPVLTSVGSALSIW